MQNVFQTYHPAVAFVYLACALALTMACMHPVYAALSLAGALACSCVCRGGRATALSLRWVVPLCLIVAVANPLFVASGSTELLRIGGRAIYLEALVYGLCSGAMFAAVFLWFASYAACMNSENSLALFGNVLPKVTLMVSQVLRLVPQFVSRGHAIAAVQDCASAAAPTSKKEQARGRMRIVSVLMGWGMEDALERSDAMRARGYDCGAKRTTYARFHFGHADMQACIVIVCFALVSAYVAFRVCSGFAFYPVMSELPFWQVFVPYAIFLSTPVVLWLKDWWQWRKVK